MMADHMAEAVAPPPLSEFFAHAWQARRRAGFIFAAIVGAALLLAALVPARFEAAATLTVLPAPEFTVREEAGSAAQNNNALALDQIMKTETEILESDSLHQAAIASLGAGQIYPDLAPTAAPGWVSQAATAVLGTLLTPWRTQAGTPEQRTLDSATRRFAQHLTVLPAKDSNVIELHFTNPDPEIAAAALNILLAQYAAARGVLYNDPQEQAVRDAANQAATTLNQSASALSAFKQAQKIANFGAQRDLLVAREGQFDQEAAEAGVRVAEDSARLLALDQQLRTEPATIDLYREQDADSRVQALADTLAGLRSQLAAAQINFRDTSERVRQLRAQIASAAAEQVARHRNPTPSVDRAGRNPNFDSLRLDRARATADLQAARAAQTASLALAARTATDLATLNRLSQTLDSLERSQTLAADNFADASHLLAARHLTEAEDSRRLARVRVVQPALVPVHAENLPTLILLAGLLAGATACLADLVLRHSRATVFFTPEGLEHATGLPVLAVFPPEPVDHLTLV